MDLRVHHRSLYRYSHPVHRSHHLLYLRPRTTERQSVLSASVELRPAAASRFVFTDKFGNIAEEIEIHEPHTTLEVIAEADIVLRAPWAIDTGQSAPWEEVRRYVERPSRHTIEIVPYLFNARYTAPTRAIEDYARESFPPGRPVLDAAIDIMTRINRDFRYDPTATDVKTPVEHAFAMRAGVCQDLAHVAIACLRSIGLAARYVSGYLLTDPPDNQERLRGADHSHAWFSVYAPPFGWIDLDPTNNCLPAEGHVTLAWGRDYADVAPISGTVTGGGDHHIEVAVAVTPV